MTADKLEDWEVELLTKHGLVKARAAVVFLPTYSGEGYQYGGGAVVTIGEFALMLGEGREAGALAKAIAARWNQSLPL